MRDAIKFILILMTTFLIGAWIGKMIFHGPHLPEGLPEQRQKDGSLILEKKIEKPQPLTQLPKNSQLKQSVVVELRPKTEKTPGSGISNDGESSQPKAWALDRTLKVNLSVIKQGNVTRTIVSSPDFEVVGGSDTELITRDFSYGVGIAIDPFNKSYSVLFERDWSRIRLGALIQRSTTDFGKPTLSAHILFVYKF